MPSIAARWRGWERAGSQIVQAGPLSPITYPTTPLRPIVEIAPGADLTADPSTWSWVDVTDQVRFASGVSTTVGRRDQAGTVDPSRASLTLNNRHGNFSPGNPVGPYYGGLNLSTPIRMGVDPGDGMHYRYHGYVNAWPKRWDRSGNDAFVPITCGGIMRQLSRRRGVKSPLYGTMSGVAPNDVTPLAYWTMEDGVGATQAASGLPGGTPMTTSGLTFGADTDLAGASALPTMGATAEIQWTVPAYTSTGQWVVQWVMKVPSEPSAETLLWEVRTTNPARNYRLLAAPGSPATLYLRTYTGGTLESEATMPLDGTGGPDATETNFFGEWLMFGMSSSPFGGSIAVEVKIFDDQGANWLPSSSLGQIVSSTTTGVITGGGVSNSGGGLTGAGFGHVGVYTSASFNVATDQTTNASAMNGWAGEQAHERIIRICRELAIPLQCTTGRSAPMGAQARGAILDILRDCEKADLGVLYEHEFGLGYRSITEYYNQPVSLALDFDRGHVGEPPEPTTDDLRYRNQWTVNRSGGSSATETADDYDQTQALLDGSTTVNVETDAQLSPVASWLVHRDTNLDDYWTGITMKFSRAPDIIPGWTSLPYGARVTITNPPSQVDPGDIDVIVEGWTERWDTVTWQATLNTSPASTYQVAVIEGAGGITSPTWRLEAGSSTLAADIDSDDTSLSIATSSGPLLSTSAADYPCDVEIGGEQMTATSASGAVSPQTVTVVRSVNGVVKSHTAGATFRGWRLPVPGL
jgi:hypothetical protein